ncbi:MAG: hypothetical protein ACOZHQ_13980 [Thermodesulfobacteriota bacterium]
MLGLNDLQEKNGEALRTLLGKTMMAALKEPTVANQAAYDKARKALEEFEAQQAQGKPAAVEGETAAERSFKNPRQVAAFLAEQGWKISENTAYNHRDRGMLRPDKDGLFHEASVLRYAASNLKRKDGGGSEKLEALQERKVLAEIERAEAQAAKMRLQQEILEGKYIPLEQYQRDLATRARLLKADMLNWARLFVEEFIFLVGGDQAQAPEALALTERQVEDWLHRYASQGEIRLAAPRKPENRRDAV